MQVKLAAILVVAASLLPRATAHGFLKLPRSRNFIAHEDGKWWSDDGLTHPRPESCPHCLNRGGTASACGIVGGNDYSFPKTTDGNPFVSAVQGNYTEGGIVEIEFVLTAHHKGHVELSVCPTAGVPTQACFDAHPAVFVEDVLYGAPPDKNHPGRGYIAPNDGRAVSTSSAEVNAVGGMPFKMRFRLPAAGVAGHRVALQWHYVTGNSCRSPGYEAYPWPSPDWHSPLAPPCPSPLPPTGEGTPEQFWNCADVAIEPRGGDGGDGDGAPSQPNPRPETPPPPAPSSPPAEDDDPSPPMPPPAEDEAPPGGDAPHPCSSGAAMAPSFGCRGFYHCRGGAPLGEEIPCPSGTLFDESANYCNWQRLVDCQAPVDSPPPSPAPTPSPSPSPEPTPQTPPSTPSPTGQPDAPNQPADPPPCVASSGDVAAAAPPAPRAATSLPPRAALLAASFGLGSVVSAAVVSAMYEWRIRRNVGRAQLGVDHQKNPLHGAISPNPRAEGV